MKEMKLLESLQYLEDGLLEESESASFRRKTWAAPAAAAACLLIAAGAAFTLPRVLRTRPLPDPGWLNAVTASPAGSGETSRPTGAFDLEPRPGATAAATPAPPPPGPAAEPDPLYWNELTELPAGGGSAWYLLVGEALTEGELSACAPGTEEWWIEGCEGYATYIGAEGAGGLAWVTLLVSAEELEDPIQVTIRDTDAPEPPRLPGLPGPEEAHAGRLNDQEYRAFRYRYEDGQGAARAWLSAVFEKDGVEFNLLADVPEALEKTAGMDLHWLIAAYSRTPVPDLGGLSFKGEEN